MLENKDKGTIYEVINKWEKKEKEKRNRKVGNLAFIIFFFPLHRPATPFLFILLGRRASDGKDPYEFTLTRADTLTFKVLLTNPLLSVTSGEPCWWNPQVISAMVTRFSIKLHGFYGRCVAKPMWHPWDRNPLCTPSNQCLSVSTGFSIDPHFDWLQIGVLILFKVQICQVPRFWIPASKV